VLESDNALVRQGIETELHAWDGLHHAFWYNSTLPESREVYDVIARFFDLHLSKGMQNRFGSAGVPTGLEPPAY
jgi:epsilon-lactone hydrolase